MPRSFKDALSSNVIPQRIGSLILRYDDSLLIGQSERPSILTRGWTPEVGIAATASSGIITLLLLMVPGGGYWAPAFTALLSGACLWATFALEEKNLPPARFVLNFVSETLRLERQTRSPFRRKVRTVPFDDVLSVQITGSEDEVDGEGTGDLRLTVQIRRLGSDFRVATPNPRPKLRWLTSKASEKRPERWEIAQRVPMNELEALRRFERFLHNAFGLPSSED